MEQQPLVTIGIPFYNEEKYLADTIESAINQSHPNICIILSDNGSTDSSGEIAKKYQKEDGRVQYFRHDKNEGPIFNFTFTFQKCESPFFVWLGGHDMFAPTYVADALEVFRRYPDTALAYPGCVSVDIDGKKINEITDNYDTSALSTSEGILKIARNFKNGYVIHGVFRTKILKLCPIEKVFGPDIAMIFKTGTLGVIRQIPGVGFYRRTVRLENAKQAHDRHHQLGVFKRTTTNPFASLLIVVSRHVLQAPCLSVTQKIGLFWRLRKIWRKRFGVNWMDLFRSLT